jgi:hypothetical protein
MTQGEVLSQRSRQVGGFTTSFDLVVFWFAICAPWLLLPDTTVPVYVPAGVAMAAATQGRRVDHLSRAALAIVALAYCATVLTLLSQGASSLVPAIRLLGVIAFAIVFASRTGPLVERGRSGPIPDFLGISLVAVALLLLVPMIRPNSEPLRLFLEGVAQARQDRIQAAFRLSFSRLESLPFDLGRNSNNLRHTLAIGLVMGICLDVLRDRSRSSLQLARIAIGVAAIALILSRSAWLICLMMAMPPALRVAKGHRRRGLPPRRVAAYVAGLTAIVVGWIWARDVLWERLSGADDVSAEVRTEGAAAAWRSIVQSAPLAPDVEQLTRSPHNLPLEMGLDGGIVAAFLGALIVLIAGVVALRAIRNYVRHPSPEGFAIWGLMSVVLVRAFSAGNAVLTPQLWVSLFTALAIDRHLRRGHGCDCIRSPVA